MAKIIELSGTPGAGKSTLYKEMAAACTPQHHWMPAHQLYPKVQLPLKSITAMAGYLFQKLTKGNNRLDANAMREAGDRFVDQNQPYLDACWNNIVFRQKETFNGMDLRFKKAAFLYTTIQQVQTIKESKLSKYALLDEGLVHKVTGGGLYKSKNVDEEREELLDMLAKTPLPDAFVFLHSDAAETTLRLAQRKRVINMHKSLSAAEIELVTLKTQERMDIANKYLEGKGVPVLYLDAKLSSDDKKAEMMKFFTCLK